MNFLVYKVFPSPYYLFSLPVPFDRQVAGTTAYLLIWLGLSPTLGASWAQVGSKQGEARSPKGRTLRRAPLYRFKKRDRAHWQIRLNGSTEPACTKARVIIF